MARNDAKWRLASQPLPCFAPPIPASSSLAPSPASPTRPGEASIVFTTNLRNITQIFIVSLNTFWSLFVTTNQPISPLHHIGRQFLDIESGLSLVVDCHVRDLVVVVFRIVFCSNFVLFNFFFFLNLLYTSSQCVDIQLC